MTYRKLVVASGLMLALTAAAEANTIASSTMWFQGSLTVDGSGYTGVAYMVNEQSLGIGDGIAGYDLYCLEGGTAWYGNDPDGTGPQDPVWTSETISNHDPYSSGSPDTPDWYQYSLELSKDGSDYKWAVRNHAGATPENPHSTIARGVPMSGTMNWTTGIAAETDTGAYISGTGTPEIPGGAASKGGGAAYWDMDWSWGSEAWPLAAGGLFDVTVTDLGGGTYQVQMSPVPEPFSIATVFMAVGGLRLYYRRKRKVQIA